MNTQQPNTSLITKKIVELEKQLELEKAINEELTERQDLMETENKELKARLDGKTQEAEAYREYMDIDFSGYSNVDERCKRLNDFVREKGINFVPFCEKNNHYSHRMCVLTFCEKNNE